MGLDNKRRNPGFSQFYENEYPRTDSLFFELNWGHSDSNFHKTWIWEKFSPPPTAAIWSRVTECLGLTANDVPYNYRKKIELWFRDEKEENNVRINLNQNLEPVKCHRPLQIECRCYCFFLTQSRIYFRDKYKFHQVWRGFEKIGGNLSQECPARFSPIIPITENIQASIQEVNPLGLCVQIVCPPIFHLNSHSQRGQSDPRSWAFSGEVSRLPWKTIWLTEPGLGEKLPPSSPVGLLMHSMGSLSQGKKGFK